MRAEGCGGKQCIQAVRTGAFYRVIDPSSQSRTNLFAILRRVVDVAGRLPPAVVSADLGQEVTRRKEGEETDFCGPAAIVRMNAPLK